MAVKKITTKSAPPKLTRAAVAPPEQSIERANVGAALSRISDYAIKVPMDCRIVEDHVAKLEQALAAEQRAHSENIATQKAFYEAEVSRIEAEHREEVAAAAEALTRMTAERDRFERGLEQIRIKNLAAQRELGSVQPYTGIDSLR